MKCTLIRRLVQLPVATCALYCVCLVALVNMFTYCGTYNYPHIPEDQIEEELYRETNADLVKKASVQCTYEEILSNTSTLYGTELNLGLEQFSPDGIYNGSYSPDHCNPAFSVAVLVTYRNRQQQLDLFIPYIHNFLRRQNIHYRIYVIEQQDERPWNKGLLYNVGARRAIADKFPCVILHDVDLVPLDAGNLYACARSPRHMSASIDKFRFVLPYPGLVGGVLALPAHLYRRLDGLSNDFLGWGGEDDDFYNRITAKGLHVIRFPIKMSRYTMLRHPPEQKNEKRYRLLSEKYYHQGAGYAAASARTLHVVTHRLFTLIAVRT